MTDSPTPADPQQLRAEIEQTRAELGETVEQLAAKTDVKARARQALGDARGKARHRLTGLKDQVVHKADVVSTKAATAQQQLSDSGAPARLGRPLPLAAIAVAAAVIISMVVVRRRRA